MRGLTLNHEPNIGHPYASRNRCDGPLPVLYDDAGGTHEQMTVASPNCGGLTCGAQSRATRKQWPSTQRAENEKTTKNVPTDIHPSDGEMRGALELGDKLGLKSWLVRMQVHMG